jgi:hypothetical protein
MDYLSKTQLKPQKDDFRTMVDSVRKLLRDKGILFGPPKLVGSARRNMVFKGNSGYDLDYQFRLGATPSTFSIRDIKQSFINAFNIEAAKLGLQSCEDSTHVITIKKLDGSKVLYSYDIALLEKNSIDKYMILKNEKRTGKDEDYHYNELKDCVDFDSEYKKIKGSGQWERLRAKYKDKKALWQDIAKDKRPPSVSILREAVNEVLQEMK